MQPITARSRLGFRRFTVFSLPSNPVAVSSADCLTTHVFSTTTSASEISSSRCSPIADIPAETRSESATFIWQPTVQTWKDVIVSEIPWEFGGTGSVRRSLIKDNFPLVEDVA